MRSYFVETTDVQEEFKRKAKEIDEQEGKVTRIAAEGKLLQVFLDFETKLETDLGNVQNQSERFRMLFSMIIFTWKEQRSSNELTGPRF